MKVTIKKKFKNKSILCCLPQQLPGNIVNKSDSIEVENMESVQLGDFSLSNFLSRFLSGGESIKKLRAVSRKRLALIGSGVNFDDIEAATLFFQVQRYKNAKEFLFKLDVINLDDLLKLNHMLIANDNGASGMLRNGQNWAGGKTIQTAYYIPPPPEYVQPLMKNLVEFLNNKTYPLITRFIVAHNQLLNVHPFSDGNGRVARVLLDVGLEKTFGSYIHPCIQRMLIKDDSYIDAVQSTLDEESEHGVFHPFWHDSFSSSGNIITEINKILNAASKLMSSRLLLHTLSLNTQKLLNYLWEQPIVSEKGLQSKFGWNMYVSHAAISELLNLNILEKRLLSRQSGIVIYDSPLVFDTWKQIEAAIFCK